MLPSQLGSLYLSALNHIFYVLFTDARLEISQYENCMASLTAGSLFIVPTADTRGRLQGRRRWVPAASSQSCPSPSMDLDLAAISHQQSHCTPTPTTSGIRAGSTSPRSESLLGEALLQRPTTATPVKWPPSQWSLSLRPTSPSPSFLFLCSLSVGADSCFLLLCLYVTSSTSLVFAGLSHLFEQFHLLNSLC